MKKLLLVCTVALVLAMTEGCGTKLPSIAIPTTLPTTSNSVAQNDPTPTATPSATPTPTPTPGCTIDSSGSSSQGFTNTFNGQPYTVTIQGTLTCTDGTPNPFTLFSFEIDNYCDTSSPEGRNGQNCTITEESIVNNGDGTFSVEVNTTNVTGDVYPEIATLIPSSNY
jgi:hypothetical protein